MAKSTMKKKRKNYTINDLDRDIQKFEGKFKDLYLNKQEINEFIDQLLLTKNINLFGWHFNYKIYGLFISLLILLLSILLIFFNYDQFLWHLSAIGRILMIQILPYFDWQYLKNTACLIGKTEEISYSVASTQFNCDLCESFNNFDNFYLNQSLASNKEFIQALIDLDKPIIISGAINHWIKNSTEEFFGQMWDKRDFSNSIPCQLRSNVHNSMKENQISIKDLMRKLKIHHENFYVHFQNCEKDAIRIFRQFSFRPEIIPDKIAPVTFNWLIWNKNFSTLNYKKINLIEKYTVFGQIFGSSKIKLLPRENCAEFCQPLEGILETGYIIIFTSLWDLEYLPFAGNNNKENLAVILEL